MRRKTYRENWVAETIKAMRESGQYTEEFLSDWAYLWEEMGADLRDLEGMLAATGGE